MKHKIKKTKKKFSPLFFIIPISFLFIVGFWYYINTTISKSDKFLQNPQKNIIKVASISAVIKIIPTETITPKPTVPAYTGFCLNVPVLMYHHIQPNTQAQEKKQTSLSVDNGMFDSHMQYLVSKGYTFITAKQLAEALKSNTQLPTKSIVITIDDGYKDSYTYAYPILQKYHIQANIMLATGLLGEEDYLTWDQINEMKNSGLIYFTDHTWSHYNVGAGSRDKIEYEIKTAKQQIEERTGQQIDIFTYPYGTFGPLAMDVLQQNGFIGAFSTTPGTYQCDSFIFFLHRTRVGNSHISGYGV